MARYRDRKYNRTVSYVGYNAYADATTRGQIRNAFEPGTSIVGNWDVMEGVLDTIFVNLGIEAENAGIGRPILMTEAVANLGYSRKSTCQRSSSLESTKADLYSYERTSLRVLLCALTCLRNRFAVLIQIQQREQRTYHLILALLDARNTCVELEASYVQRVPAELGWLSRR